MFLIKTAYPTFGTSYDVDDIHSLSEEDRAFEIVEAFLAKRRAMRKA